jgi:outer membrane protein TolC
MAKMAWLAVSPLLLLAARAQAEEPPPARGVAFGEAVRQALERNPSAVVAREEIYRAEALEKEARSNWYPTLTGTGTYTRLDSDRLFNGNVISPRDSFNAYLLLTVPIIAPKYWAASSHAADQVDVARWSGADVRRQVAVAVGRAYLGVVAQRRVVEANQLARDTAKAHWAYAHQRYAGGVGNRIDDVRAEQELASDEAQVQAALSNLVKAREALGVLMGLNEAVDATENPKLPDPGDTAIAMDQALHRPDIAELEEKVRAAHHVVKDDWTDYSPTLTGIGQPFYQDPPTLTQPLWGWQAQLVLSIPFYDGGLRYGLAKERDALEGEARANLEGGQRQARSDVRAALESVARADDALKAARDAARLAKEAEDLAELAYRSGATTNLEVIDAESRLRDATTAVAVAEDTAQQARLDFLAATGRFP